MCVQVDQLKYRAIKSKIKQHNIVSTNAVYVFEILIIKKVISNSFTINLLAVIPKLSLNLKFQKL